MTRKTLVEMLLGIFVVTLVLSNVLLASQVVAFRERIPFMVSRAAALAQERIVPTATPTPSMDSLLTDDRRQRPHHLHLINSTVSRPKFIPPPVRYVATLHRGGYH